MVFDIQYPLGWQHVHPSNSLLELLWLRDDLLTNAAFPQAATKCGTPLSFHPYYHRQTLPFLSQLVPARLKFDQMQNMTSGGCTGDVREKPTSVKFLEFSSSDERCFPTSCYKVWHTTQLPTLLPSTNFAIPVQAGARKSCQKRSISRHKSSATLRRNSNVTKLASFERLAWRNGNEKCMARTPLFSLPNRILQSKACWTMLSTCHLFRNFTCHAKPDQSCTHFKQRRSKQEDGKMTFACSFRTVPSNLSQQVH